MENTNTIDNLPWWQRAIHHARIVRTHHLPWWENVTHYLVVYSVSMYLIEVCYFQTDNSFHGPPFFKWSERVVADLLTIEYFYRAFKHNGGWRYVFSWMGFVDALAIVPFWCGYFFHSVRVLHVIRDLRIFRLLKLFRYSEAMQDFVKGIRVATPQLMAVGQIVFVGMMLSATLMHEIERDAQPKLFGTLGESLWWTVVTMTTVGYGDAYPITTAGRIVASATMLLGVGLMASFIGIFGGACFQPIKRHIDAHRHQEQKEKAVAHKPKLVKKAAARRPPAD